MDEDRRPPEPDARVLPERPTELADRLPPDIAERAAARIERETDAQVRLGAVAQRDALAAEQERDTDDTFAAGQVGVMTGSQARGAVKWSVIGGVVGGVIGLLIGLIPIADLAIGARIGILVIVGILAGSAAGFVYGGGRQPELEGKVRDSSHELAVEVTAADRGDAVHADEVLGQADIEAARRLRRRAESSDDGRTVDGSVPES
jgi:hypothetical protein